MIKHRHIQLAILSISVLLLTACMSTSEDAKTAVAISSEMAAQDPYQPLLNRANRYHRSRSSIPRAMKQQAALIETHVESADWRIAEETLKNAVVRWTENSEMHVVAGDFFRQKAASTKSNEPLHRAAEHYLQAIDLNPMNYLAHNRLAGVLRQQGEFQKALSHYQQAIDSWPGFALAYRNRGILKDLYLGDKQGALEDYQTYQGLVQLTQGKADRQTKGWIADLQRQLKQNLARTGGNYAN